MLMGLIFILQALTVVTIYITDIIMTTNHLKTTHSYWRTVFAILKYPITVIIIYIVINLWRSPTMPNAPTLYYLKDGQVVDVMSLSQNTPVLVYFWGTWCGVCRATSPNVQTLHDDGVAVLSVAVSSGSDGDLAGYMQTHGYDFYTINDRDGAEFTRWGGQVTPSFVIIKDGKASQRFTGIAPLWSLRLRLWWAQL